MMDRVKSVLSLLVMALIFCFITSAYSDCDSPSSISYGFLKEEFANKESFKVGDTVQYRCRPGFIRILGTRNTITCMGNSKWTKHDTFCTVKSCGHPGDTENGYFEASGFLFGAKTTYYCNEGYNMISRKHYRFCQEDGSWSNAVPQCEVVTCPHPASIPYGTFSPEKEDYHYLDAIRYQCNNSRSVLYGANFPFCTENGTWSSNPPKCIDVDCPSPQVHAAQKVSGFTGPYTLNTAVSFECLEGFIMNGSKNVICNIRSQWEPSLPTCKRNFCYAPQLKNGRIKNGELKHFNNETGFQIKESIKMGCDTLFVLNGQSTITCQEDLNWHPEVPICEKWFGCSSPKILNGRVTLKNGENYNPEKDGHAFSNSDRVHVQCDEGFGPVGNSISSECKFSWGSHVWSPALATCQRWRVESIKMTGDVK